MTAHEAVEALADQMDSDNPDPEIVRLADEALTLFLSHATMKDQHNETRKD